MPSEPFDCAVQWVCVCKFPFVLTRSYRTFGSAVCSAEWGIWCVWKSTRPVWKEYRQIFPSTVYLCVIHSCMYVIKNRFLSTRLDIRRKISKNNGRICSPLIHTQKMWERKRDREEFRRWKLYEHTVHVRNAVMRAFDGIDGALQMASHWQVGCALCYITTMEYPTGNMFYLVMAHKTARTYQRNKKKYRSEHRVFVDFSKHPNCTIFSVGIFSRSVIYDFQQTICHSICRKSRWKLIAPLLFAMGFVVVLFDLFLLACILCVRAYVCVWEII